MKNINALTLFNPQKDSLDWDELFNAMLPRLYNYFLYRTGREQTAQDLTSTVFERAWSKKSRYRSDQARVESWMFGIARNVFKEYLREHKKIARSETSFEDTILSDQNSETDNLDKKILLTSLIAQLQERDQELVALKYGAGLNNREIAKLTHLTESNVGTRLFRTIEYLRTQMEVKNE